MNVLLRARGAVASFFLRAANVLDPRQSDVRDVEPAPPDLQEAAVPARRGHIPSLFAAADQLDAAVATPPETPGWRRSVRRAVNASLAALEGHIGSVSGVDGLASDIWANEPRLLHAVEQLQADLARTITEAWEARDVEETPSPETIEDLRRLSRDVRRIAEDEFFLLHESMRTTPAED